MSSIFGTGLRAISASTCLALSSCGYTNGNSDTTSTSGDSVSFTNSIIEPAAFDSSAQIALEIHSIFEDKSGNIWFGLNSFGVCRYNPNAAPGSDSAFMYFTEKEGLISNHVGTITQDNAGNMWFATAYGVCRYDGNSFVNFTDKQQQPISPPGVEIKNSQVTYFWFGTNSGVYRCDGQVLEYLPMPLKSGDPFVTGKYPVQPNGYTVYCALTAQNNESWFATTGQGIGRYDGQVFTYYRDIAQLDGVPRGMYQDRSGKIWVGSNGGGVSYFDGKKWVNYCAEQGLGSDHSTSNMEDPLRKLNRVWSITEDHAGNMWFGTMDEGVWKYDPVAKTMTNYTMKDGLTSNSVWVVFTDRSGKLWVGTDGGGVCAYDGSVFRNFTRN